MSITVHLIAADGARRTLHGRAGQSLMRLATGEGVEQIAADCGGCLTCATCHVVVDAAWRAPVGEPGAEENDMLEHTAAPRTEGSRLSCQIVLQPALDGLTVHLPERQY